MAARRLEVCVEDPAGLAAAIEGGAHRVELCSALALGGLTPGPGLIAAAAAAPVRVHAMIRPRAGSFEADAALLDAMRRDIDAVRAAGLAGVVLGVSLASGALDVPGLRRLCDHAAGLDRTLHRAFDVAPDREEALESAVALGFDRILTSGGARSALEGVEAIAAATAQAAGRLAVMPGAGIGPANVGDIVRRTGARDVHASCGIEAETPARVHMLGFAPPRTRVTLAAAVADLAAALEAVED